MTHIYATIGALQEGCSRELLSRESFIAGLMACGESEYRGSTEHERVAIDIAIEEGVKVLGRDRPHGKKSMERWQEQAKVRTEQRFSMICGIDPVTLTVVLWLIGQALTWLWRYWVYHEKTGGAALICGMAGGS